MGWRCDGLARTGSIAVIMRRFSRETAGKREKRFVQLHVPKTGEPFDVKRWKAAHRTVWATSTLAIAMLNQPCFIPLARPAN